MLEMAIKVNLIILAILVFVPTEGQSEDVKTAEQFCSDKGGIREEDIAKIPEKTNLDKEFDDCGLQTDQMTSETCYIHSTSALLAYHVIKAEFGSCENFAIKYPLQEDKRQVVKYIMDLALVLGSCPVMKQGGLDFIYLIDLVDNYKNLFVLLRKIPDGYITPSADDYKACDVGPAKDHELDLLKEMVSQAFEKVRPAARELSDDQIPSFQTHHHFFSPDTQSRDSASYLDAYLSEMQRITQSGKAVTLNGKWNGHPQERDSCKKTDHSVIITNAQKISCRNGTSTWVGKVRNSWGGDRNDWIVLGGGEGFLAENSGFSYLSECEGALAGHSSCMGKNNFVNLPQNPGKCNNIFSTITKSGHVKSIRTLLQGDQSRYLKDDQGRTPLRIFIEKGDIASALEFMVGDIDGEDRLGETPLFAATQLGSQVLVEALLEKDANPNKQNKTSSDTPLHIAAKRCNKELVATLIEHGAELNKNSWDETPLHMAIAGCEADFLDYFLQVYKAKYPAQDLREEKLLEYVTSMIGNIEMIKVLQKHGFNIHKEVGRGKNLISLAIDKQNYDLAEELIKIGIRIGGADSMTLESSKQSTQELGQDDYDIDAILRELE